MGFDDKISFYSKQPGMKLDERLQRATSEVIQLGNMVNRL